MSTELGQVSAVVSLSTEPDDRSVLWFHIIDDAYPTEGVLKLWDMVSAWEPIANRYWLVASVDYNQTTPPVSPSTGDTYLIASSGATGAWDGHDNNLATWLGHSWAFVVPKTGSRSSKAGSSTTTFFFNGTAWLSIETPSVGAMIYRGAFSSLTVGPVAANAGDTYVLTVSGTLSWAGITFNPSAVVQVGDVVIKRDASNYDVIQGNAIPASETVAGIIEIATAAEVAAGTDDSRAITPLKLNQVTEVLETDISNNADDISTVASNVSSLSSTVSTNTTNISTVASSLATTNSNVSSLSTTVATKQTVFIARGYPGIDHTGATDSTTGFQNLITAAQAAGIYKIKLGIGIFKCNIVLPECFAIEGEGGGIRTNYTIPVSPELTPLIYPSILIPNSTGSPTVRVNSCYGVRLTDFMIQGSASQLGEGLTISNGVNFPGSSMSVHRVSVRGFFSGLANYGGCDITYSECLFGSSVRNVGQYPAADSAPSDTQTFLNCVTGGATSTWNFYFQGCRGTSIVGGDHNLAAHIMYIANGGAVNWTNANSEQISSHLFELAAGTLNINEGRFNIAGGIGGVNKALVRITGSTTALNIGPIIFDGVGAVTQTATYGTILETNQLTAYPQTLPIGFAIHRYNSDFTTLIRTEFTHRVYRNTAQLGQVNSVVDEFTRGYTTPFGDNNWLITSIAGSSITGRYPTAGVQGLVGLIELPTGSGTSGDRGRFATEQALFNSNSWNEWEMEWWLYTSAAVSTYLRAGLMSTTAAETPTYFLGIKAAGGTDTNVRFQINNNGSLTADIDTGVAIAALNTHVKIRIRKIANASNVGIGYTCQIGDNAEVYTSTVSGSSAYQAGCVIGNTAAAFATVRIDRFTLRF